MAIDPKFLGVWPPPPKSPTAEPIHWAVKLGVKNAEEARILNDLVGVTTQAQVETALDDGRIILMRLADIERRLEQLERRNKVLEKILMDAGKTEWDKFEELTG